MNLKKLFSFILTFILIFSNLTLPSFSIDTENINVTDFSVELESFLAENAQYSTSLPSVDDGSTETPEEICTNRLIVSTDSNKALDDDCCAVSKIEGFNNWHVFQYDSEEACFAALDYYSSLDSVNYVEIDEVLYVEDLYTDDLSVTDVDCWGMDKVDSYEALDFFNSKNVSLEPITVAVIDTGVDETHPLFKKNSENSRIYDGNRDKDNTLDTSYEKYHHGTCVAGIIVNNTPINVKIKSYNYFYYRGKKVSGTTITLATEIKSAVSDNVDVINMSLSGEGQLSKTLEAELDKAINAGIVIVTSAGNYNRDSIEYYPANYPKAITVAANNSLNKPCVFNATQASNYGSIVDISAPGEKIRTSYPDNLYTNSFAGTSAAAPFVSASAAIIKSVDPNRTPAEIENLIKSTAYVPEGWDTNYGVGIVNYMNILDTMTMDSPEIEFINNEKHNPEKAVITSSPNAKIYFTTNNTEPIVGKSALYTEPIDVTGLDIIKAVAVKDGMLPSKSVSKTVDITVKKTVRYKGSLDLAAAKRSDFKSCYVANKEIVTFEGDGTIKAHKVGKTDVVVFVDCGKKVTYEITVEYEWWQQWIRLFLLGFLWY